MLGEQHYLGVGVTQDYKEAVKWLFAAADQGEIQAQIKLGRMLAAGGDVDDPKPEQGVPQDYVSAYSWLDLAAAAGDAGAKDERDRVQTKMTLKQLAEARRLAYERLQSQQRAAPN